MSRRGRRILRFSPYIVIIGLSTTFVIKSVFGEEIDNKKYDDIRDQIVQEEFIDKIEPVKIVEDALEDVVNVGNIEDIGQIDESDEEPIPEEPKEIISDELLQNGYEFKNVDFEKLLNLNEDSCGWLTIDGSSVDYPLVHANNVDNNFYLHHDIEKNPSQSGAIYVDNRCNTLNNKTYDLSDVTLVYGHHMKGSKMLGSICNYTKQSYYDEHPYAVIYTPDGYAYKASFFGGIIESGESDEHIYASNLQEQEKYDNFIEYIRENSTFQSEVELEYGDKIIGFVTCEYTGGKNSRYILFAKLEKQYTNELQITEQNELDGALLNR